MPVTFFEIERERGRRIWALFAILLGIYVAAVGTVLAVAFVLHEFFAGRGWAWFASWRGIVLTVVASFALGAVHWLLSRRDPVRRLVEGLRARLPDPEDRYHERLADIVEELAVAGGGASIRPLVIPTASMNAFAVGDLRGGGAIGVTEGLLSRLGRPQLQAVLAHEAAHILSGDGDLAAAACLLFGIYTKIARGMDALIERDIDKGLKGRGGGGSVAVLGFARLGVGAVRLLSFVVNMAISRQREIRADAAAVRLTRDPIALAEALREMARGSSGVGEIPEGLAPLMAIDVSRLGLSERDGWIASLLATHPPVRRRIRTLLDMAHVRGIEALRFFHGSAPRIPLEAVSDPGSQDVDWWARGEDGWAGPYTIGALLVLPGFGPQAWVRRGESGEPFPAGSSPVLSGLLARAIPRHARSGRACPRCHQPLVRVAYEGVPLERCPFCRGHLLQRDLLHRVVARREARTFPEAAFRLAEAAARSRPRRGAPAPPAGALHCPCCGHAMRRGPYSYLYAIEVDRCFRCRLLWFDRNELEALQIAIERQEERALTVAW